MIDLHAHIIPNLDDGADSYAEAEMIAQDAVDGGTTAMAATPHFFNRRQCLTDSSREYVMQQFRLLREHLLSAGIELDICPGAELFAGHDLEQVIEQQQIITLNSSRYVLTEFDFSDRPARVFACIDKLFRANYLPVIAHPERYEFLQDEPHLVYRLLERGCVLQLNKGSPFGAYGDRTAEFSHWMLHSKLVHAVASDCHSPYRRTANMANAHRVLSLQLGEEYANAIFQTNPQKILSGASVL